jgi:DNA repair protein SbcD/Mre11
VVRIIHTSDVQLDAPFRFLGEKGPSHRARLLATFQRIIDLVHSSQSDLFVISGDLFNDNRPSESTIQAVIDALAAAVVPVCLLPGNHDCYDAHSVYRHADFSANVHVLADTPSTVDLPQLDLTVCGWGIQSARGGGGSLGAHLPPRRRRWQIALAHGNVQVPGRISSAERPIAADEIASTPADYVALGDWHALSDQSVGGVKAYYSGSPEPTAIDALGSGFVCQVDLAETGVTVTPVRIGATSVDALSLDVADRTQVQLTRAIRGKASDDLILDVVLAGLASPEQIINAEAIQAIAAPGFYWLRVTDQSHLMLRDLNPDEFPAMQVLGQYVEILTARIEAAATDEERHIAEQALQYGVALLRGKKVLG